MMTMMVPTLNRSWVSNIEIEGLAKIALPIAQPRSESAGPAQPPSHLKTDEERRNWQQAEQAKEDAADKRVREQAANAFRKELVQRLDDAFEAGAQHAVSAQARRSITVRGYVLYIIIAAVVAMPLLAMWLGLDPQAFGAFIAPVTGIAGTIVGYWFGSAGQSPSQGVTQPPGGEQPRRTGTIAEDP
jgi:hypothetical protein